ncbi:MAG: 1-deoxy-D-xylulose-5-phosphate synthase, partial [Proteobacteria bacterium]|nr:1-deoxy-D-xylulose-5-phosphate synthase [Pseudomonadota bacterium]
GEKLMGMARKAEDSLITLFTPGMLFEGLGFHYIGPIDGHDVKGLIETLGTLKDLEGPVLLHVLTKKGKGYAPAERDPSTFHGLGPFDKETGAVPKSTKTSYTNIFSYALLDIAEKNEKVVAITAAMPGGTGLTKFEERYPDRFFDVGIAEQHAITFAAGLSKAGYMPVCAIYSTFLQRAYDEVVHDICIDKLPIVIAIDRAGIVGADGPTHHGIFDIAFLRSLPNMVVTAPKDDDELRNMLYSATKYALPTSVRYPRGTVSGEGIRGPFKKIPLGKAELLKKGSDLTIIALGTMVGEALKAAMKLEALGINAGVLNARFVKPMDEEMVLAEAVRTGRILTIEEGSLQGGFGSAVLEVLEKRGAHAIVKRLGIPDSFVEHGTQAELLAELGLDAAGIERAAIELAGLDEAEHKVAN